jgi:hypothetical protein
MSWFKGSALLAVTSLAACGFTAEDACEKEAEICDFGRNVEVCVDQIQSREDSQVTIDCVADATNCTQIYSCLRVCQGPCNNIEPDG